MIAMGLFQTVLVHFLEIYYWKGVVHSSVLLNTLTFNTGTMNHPF